MEDHHDNIDNKMAQKKRIYKSKPLNSREIQESIKVPQRTIIKNELKRSKRKEKKRYNII